ncbi:uncharacterized protein LOC134743233 isoform X2 [Cydia strobilella]|uniref:uncharacterized protein LOC134743233 isoform X2 n=1 Tax=Cydia strobilella TaxID=1100964 RepID=UPI003003B611
MSAPGTKSPLDNEMIYRYSTTAGWDDIPTEIFIYIFKKLNITSLRCCFAVNKKWREIATCICDNQYLWQALAEDGMVNNGMTQQLKTTLSWKDLYFNSFLWTKLPSAVALKLHEVEKSDVRNMHVYKDKIIVVHPNSVECYDIESFQVIKSILTLNFPFAVQFVDVSVAPLNMIHYHYDDPEMTCALQHGDVIIRGFVDGEIAINLLRDDFKYNLNVQQFDQDEVKEPAVIALDICELKGMHKLFVATKHKLYNILLKYPNDRQETRTK